jgi:hypothetical protein
MESMFSRLAEALAVSEIGPKVALTAALAADWHAGKLDYRDASPAELMCGRPAKPALLPHKDVPNRSPGTPEGRARLLHAIVHIEFSAINLALDHAARFRGLPQAYYADWIGVAAEEAEHFMLLRDRLQSLGYDYGDFPPMPDCGTWPKTADDPSPAWRWYRACSKRAASMPRPHPDETGASGRPPAPAYSTSFCATKSPMSDWATAGFATSAPSAGLNPKAPTSTC